MALKETVKKWFKTGFKPTQAQFYAFFNFIRWKDEKVPTEDVQGLNELLTAKADKQAFETHLEDTDKHVSSAEKEAWNKQYSLNKNTLGELEFKKEDKVINRIPLKSEMTFADAAGNVKYSANVDKRTGYYDENSQVYYPDIKIYRGNSGVIAYGNGNTTGDSILDNLFYKINPKDSSYISLSSGGSGNVYQCLRFPAIPKRSFSFDLTVSYATSGFVPNIFFKIRVNVGQVDVNSNVSSWSNLSVNFLQKEETLEWDIVFADDLNGNIIIGVKEHGIRGQRAINIILDNLTLLNLNNGINGDKPLDFYTGFKGFGFNDYYGYNDFRIRETVFLKKQSTGISIDDANGASKFVITDNLQFDKYFKFNPAEKEVCFDDSKVQKITDDVSKIINASSIINGAYNVTETTTKNSQTYFNLNDLFLRTENRVKYFNINTSALLIPKSFNTLLNDSPNFIDYCFYLQPIGSSFKPNTFQEPILVSKIRYTESDLISAISHFNEFAIFDVFIMLRSESYNGNNTTQFVVKQNTYNSKSIITDSETSINRLYVNNSSNVKELDLDVSFRLLTKININYDGKSNPTPWGFTAKCDTYNVTLIK